MGKYWSLTEEQIKNRKGKNNHMYGRRGKLHPFYGKHHTIEARRKISEADKGRNYTKETKRKISESLKGIHNSPKTEFKKGKDHPNYGKHLSKERRKNISEAHKGIHHTEETKRKLSKINKGKNHPKYGKHLTEKHKKKLSQHMKNGGAIKARKANNAKPNKPEKIMIKLIEENNLLFNYVGDGKIWFRGETQSFNPDFLSKNPKHIIELFGDYWHNIPKAKKADVERLETYSKYGYKTLVIWEYELKNPKNVVDKITNFVENEQGNKKF